MKKLLMVVGLGMLLSKGLWATPTTRLLIVDNQNDRVIEVGTDTNPIRTFTGFTDPLEAIPLTNGNIIVADTGNNKIVERSSGGGVKWSYPDPLNPNFYPVDIKRTVWYPTGSESLLVVDKGTGSLGGTVTEYEYSSSGLGNILWSWTAPWGDIPWEAEKRPGSGTPTYLITILSGNPRVIEVESRTTGNVVTPIFVENNYIPCDAEWLPCDKILIAGVDYSSGYPVGKVIEVDKHEGIVGTITLDKYIYPNEATMIENGNILVAYGGTVAEFPRGTNTGVGDFVWSYSEGGAEFVDVEEKGIINLAKITYANADGIGTQTTLAGYCLPILQATITPPYIVATKTVYPVQAYYQPNDVATYTIQFKNTGSGTAKHVTIIDRIPDGTRYEPNSAGSNLGATIQYSDNGGMTYDAPQSAQVTHIRWIINELAPNAEGKVWFRVQIKPY